MLDRSAGGHLRTVSYHSHKPFGITRCTHTLPSRIHHSARGAHTTSCAQHGQERKEGTCCPWSLHRLGLGLPRWPSKYATIQSWSACTRGAPSPHSAILHAVRRLPLTHNVTHGMQHIQSTRRVTRATKRSCPLLPTLVRWAHAAPPRAERACVRAPECVRPFGSKNRNRGGRGGRVEGCGRQGTPVSNAAGDDRLGLLLERAHTERKGASRVGTECVEAHLVVHLQRTRVGTAVVLCARLRAFVRWWGSGREGGDCGRRGRAAQHQILRQSHNRPFEPEQRAAQGRENGWEGG